MIVNYTSKKIIVIFIQALFLVLSSSFGYAQGINVQGLSEQLRENLGNRIEREHIFQNDTIEDEFMGISALLARFYARRNYYPAWITNYGPSPQVDALIRVIRQANREGLKPDEYNLGAIEDKLREIRRAQEMKTPINSSTLISLDILLTEAFLNYSSHLLDGRINPEKVGASWYPNRYEVDPVLLLQNTLETNTIEQTLSNLIPKDQRYVRMKQALAHYRDIAARGGWNSIPDGLKLKKGDRGTRIDTLRARLITEGYLDPYLSTNEDKFDDALEQAVIKYQASHGLKADGVVGRDTLASINIPVDERVRKIELNMERLRWLPKELGNRHVFINIPNFELDFVENDRTIITMRAVVGKYSDPSPILSSEITYLVLNPSWHVPPSIARSEIIPSLRNDPSYLAKNNIKVYKIVDGNRVEINPDTVDWTQVSGKNPNYKFRQRPGARNVLGRIKFIFPNPFDVYLHDTSSPELFGRSTRTFSHGCLRVQKPIELAEYLLQGDIEWTPEILASAINKRVERTVWLTEPVPIHIAYLTAWVDDYGSIQFRNDIYG
ncbi:MAG TPA: L,D-transpeptidase family protein, partial [Thermodesulfobacteriota bacterium]